MPALATGRTLYFLDHDMPEASLYPMATGTAAVHTARCPDKPTPNEDAAALIDCGPRKAVLAVADGFGGLPAGEQAAQIALKTLASVVTATHAAGGTLRAGILDGFEKANQKVTALGIGAATTLAVIEIDNNRVRSYHVGDSMVLIVGQRGKLKLQTVSHSPVGYAVEAGLLEEDEALHHEDLHLVSNMVGSPEMRIEIGPSQQLQPRDTVVLGSDGVFDNVSVPEIVEIVRKGSLRVVTGLLAAECDRRMRVPDKGQPSKPDDLTFVLYRPVP